MHTLTHTRGSGRPDSGGRPWESSPGAALPETHFCEQGRQRGLAGAQPVSETGRPQPILLLFESQILHKTANKHPDHLPALPANHNRKTKDAAHLGGGGG